MNENNKYKKQGYCYVYCLMANDCFYADPDVSLIKVSFDKKTLLEYIQKHKNDHIYYFILKKRCDYLL